MKKQEKKPAPAQHTTHQNLSGKQGAGLQTLFGTGTQQAAANTVQRDPLPAVPSHVEFVKSLSPRKGVFDDQNYVTKQKFLGTYLTKEKYNFAAGVGKDTVARATAKGASTFGGLFIMAQGSLESGWGLGNKEKKTNADGMLEVKKEYYNLFSLMGGPAENIGTAHGHLKNYSSYDEGFNAWWNNFEAPISKYTTEKKYPGFQPLMVKNRFTIDEVNTALRQYDHYPSKGDAHSPYNADGAKGNYGLDLFTRMKLVTELRISQLQDELDAKKKELANAKSNPGLGMNIVSLDASVKILEATIKEYNDIRQYVHDQITATKAAMKQGTLKPNPNPRK